MTADPANPLAAFAYTAQSLSGESVSGTIDAPSLTEANRKLQSLQLRVIELGSAAAAPQSPRKLSGEDFRAFNTQLAYLAGAGLPIEKSLRLIADDMRTGGLAETIRQVAAELESGQSLPDAFARHAKVFPPLYSELVNAGIKTGNLSGMLLGLSRHLDLTTRLRGMLWRAIAYPLMVLVSLMLVAGFLGIFVLPQFKEIFGSFRVDLPAITQLMLGFSDLLIGYWPIILGALLVVIAGPPLLLRSIGSPLRRQQFKEMLLFPIPVVGPAIQRNLLARWCDSVKLGVEAGLDLPASITLAGQAVGSPRLIGDGQLLVEAISAGRSLDDSIPTRWIPRTVLVVLGSAAARNDLPGGLDTLSSMFQQQAESKIATIPVVLTPILILLIACLVGFTVIAMFAPFIALISSVSGPVKH